MQPRIASPRTDRPKFWLLVPTYPKSRYCSILVFNSASDTGISLRVKVNGFGPLPGSRSTRTFGCVAPSGDHMAAAAECKTAHAEFKIVPMHSSSENAAERCNAYRTYGTYGTDQYVRSSTGRSRRRGDTLQIQHR